MDEPVPESCHVVAWRPAVPGISEVFHAWIVDYAYPTHCHDTWTVLIVDDGAIRYDLDTRHRGAIGGTVTILPPGVAHNGRPSERFGQFRKRNLYLDSDFLPQDLVGPAVDGSTFCDSDLRAAISALHDRLAAPDPFDVEVRLALIAERFRRRLGRRTRPAPGQAPAEPEPAVAERLRAYLDGNVGGEVRLAAAAALFDRSPAHLVRSFKQRYRITPYSYVLGARIEMARKLLLQGESVADVAVRVGFYDQAHLARHFKRHVSVAPGRYATSGAALWR